jgi:hypothetical protein
LIEISRWRQTLLVSFEPMLLKALPTVEASVLIVAAAPNAMIATTSAYSTKS